MEEEVVSIQTIDIGKEILNTINTLCNNLLQSINKSIFPELDKLIFMNADITETTYLKSIIGSDFNHGLLVIAEFLLCAFIVYYAIRKFTTYYTGAEVESPYQFFVKAVVIGIFTGYSLTICSGVLDWTYEITQVICEIGKEKIGQKISFSTLITKLSESNTKNFDLFTFEGIITTIVSISSFTLVITFAIRYILTKVLVMLSPFAFLCLINKSTHGIFKSWLKSFGSLLLVQIILALVLLLPFAILKEKSSDVFSKLLLIGSVFALLKSTQFAKEFINGTGISTDFSSGLGGIRSLFMR